MKNIKVLGTGCANCKNTLKLIEDVAKEKGVEVQLEKIEDLKQIMTWGVLSTPGVVVDGKVVHAGGVPAPRSRVGSDASRPAPAQAANAGRGDAGARVRNLTFVPGRLSLSSPSRQTRPETPGIPRLSERIEP